MSSEFRLHRRGLCLVLSAPSGAGKSSLTRALLAGDDGLALSVSVTTRAPRPGEQEGVHYLFRDETQFASMRAGGELLEWAGVFGRFYGTPRRPVEQALEAGRDVLFDIDWQGHRQLQQGLPGDVVGVFVLPPSLPELRQRLSGRGDSEDVIRHRMDAAEAEISHWREFDHVVVNRDFDRTAASISAILRGARTASMRQRLCGE